VWNHVGRRLAARREAASSQAVRRPPIAPPVAMTSTVAPPASRRGRSWPETGRRRQDRPARAGEASGGPLARRADRFHAGDRTSRPCPGADSCGLLAAGAGGRTAGGGSSSSGSRWNWIGGRSTRCAPAHGTRRPSRWPRPGAGRQTRVGAGGIRWRARGEGRGAEMASSRLAGMKPARCSKDARPQARVKATSCSASGGMGSGGGQVGAPAGGAPRAAAETTGATASAPAGWRRAGLRGLPPPRSAHSCRRCRRS